MYLAVGHRIEGISSLVPRLGGSLCTRLDVSMCDYQYEVGQCTETDFDTLG